MAILVGFVIALLVLTGLIMVAGQAGLLRGKPPGNLGIKDGKLKRPSYTPNSVSSQADLWPEHPQRDYARIAPLGYHGDGQAALQKLADQLRTRPRTVLVTQTPHYLYAQCSTALLRFTDDLEFSLDEAAGLIHVRSSSRLGRKDHQVNRLRVEAIRKRFEASP